MSSTTRQDFDVTSEAISLIADGLDVIPLPPKSKGADGIYDGWQSLPRHTADSFRARAWEGGNIGLRTGRPVNGGYLHVADYDVNVDTPESLAALHELIPADVLDCCPTTRSGNASGNRRHFCFLSPEPLAKARRSGPWGKIELLGLGQQAVLPPSIHPDSGRPYEWIRPYDDLAGLLGHPIAPLISAERCGAWGARRAADVDPSTVDPDEAEFRQILAAAAYRADVASGKLQAALDAITPDAIDYDTFFKTGAALHYASGGDDEGLALWRRLVNRSHWHEAAVTGGPMCGGPNAGQPAKLGQRRATAQRAAEDQAKRWAKYDLDHPDPAELGTIYALAKADGWRWETKAPEADDNPIDRPVDAPKPVKPSKLDIVTPDQCRMDALGAAYVIKGLIAERQIGVIVGRPGAGKSLLAPFMGYRVAQQPVRKAGIPAPEGDEERLFDRRMRRSGPVLYVAAEDPHGMEARIALLRQKLGDAPAFNLVRGVGDLTAGSPDHAAVHQWIDAHPDASLIFIDTLARAFPAGAAESEREQHFEAVIAAARSLADRGPAVFIIHHPPKGDGDTARGSGKLEGDADVTLFLKNEGKGYVDTRAGKNRNGRDGEAVGISFAVEIEPHAWTDADGDAQSVAWCKPVANAGAVFDDLKPTEVAAFRLLQEIDPMRSGVTEDVWREACIGDNGISAARIAADRARIFRAARDGLIEKARITADCGLIRANLSDFNGLDGSGSERIAADC